MAWDNHGQLGQAIAVNAEGNVIFNRGSKESFRLFSSLIPMSFRPNEFTCKCGICSQQIISIDLVNKLQKVRDLIREPIHISSGFRCTRHQSNLYDNDPNAALNSYHCKGQAADIYVVGWSGVELAKVCTPIFNGIGVSQTWVHVDVRDHLATWVYKPLNLDDIKKEIGRI